MSDMLKTYHIKPTDRGFSSLQLMQELDPLHMHNTCFHKTLHKHMDLFLMHLSPHTYPTHNTFPSKAPYS